MRSALLLTALPVFTAIARAGDMVPFVLPWDDATPGVTDVSGWLEKPAGKHGHVRVGEDGHFYAGKNRLRFLGVNMAFGANFPEKSDAEKVAARLAKFGFNCVRFHHMDMLKAPGGIWAADGKTLDPVQLEKLDWFIAKLKEHGIYTNLNLHVSRRYPDRSDAEKKDGPQHDAGLDNFSPRMIELQRDYARDLLTHVNPHTGTSYAAEPAVAIVEVNNENALLVQWHWGGMDKFPAAYRDELAVLWNDWLAKNRPEKQRAAAWSVGAREPGPELLKTTGFTAGKGAWNLEIHDGAKATLTTANNRATLNVEASGTEKWHVQFHHTGLVLKPETYAVKFRVRADKARPLNLVLSQNHSPWKQLAVETVAVSAEWQEITAILNTTEADDNARLVFSNLSEPGLKLEIESVSLRTTAVEGNLPRDAAGRAQLFSKATIESRSTPAQRDWFQFLWDTENQYWSGMRGYLRDTLGVKALLLGTQMGWSPFPIQQQFDIIDSHSYWHHPDFLGRGWNADLWRVKNEPMAGLKGGGTLAHLSLQRVAGKPYICTEYNHPAPNTYQGETFPLICAQAARQDWDGVFAFAYSHRTNDWSPGKFPSFFDIDQHPVKMATMPAAAALFLRGDLAPLKTKATVAITLEQAVEKARVEGPRLGAEQFGLGWPDVFTRQIGLQIGTGAKLSATAEADRLAADDGQFVWDTAARSATARSERSAFFAGALNAGQRLELGPLVFTAGETRQKWAALTATVMDGNSFSNAKRILLTLTGDSENTDQKWTNLQRESVGRNWGKSPSLVEAIPATLKLPPHLRAVYPLDERGQRRPALTVQNGEVTLGGSAATIWYEVTE